MVVGCPSRSSSFWALQVPLSLWPHHPHSFCVLLLKETSVQVQALWWRVPGLRPQTVCKLLSTCFSPG